MTPQGLAILGSTGSIGVNGLKVVDWNPKRFKVVALSAYSNITLLKEQIRKYKPKYVAVKIEFISELKFEFSSLKIKFCDVEKEASQLAGLKEVDIVLLAMRGAGALEPFLEAVRKGKRIAPANKEALVIAGDMIITEARKYNAVIIPVDSEQSAIFQCLDGQKAPVKKVHLTASGGALRDVPVKSFSKMTVKDILRHPRWRMGPKITVDSATLMNKGFEFIEAQKLFGLSFEQINIVIHPEAIIHSMVEFYDGSLLAQLAVTDMRLPIQYALTYPERLDSGLKPLDLVALKSLTFQKPDLKKFPALDLALEVAQKGGTLPCVLNAVDEEVVDAFLKEKIVFTSIYKVIEKVVCRHKIKSDPTLNDIYEADNWARREAKEILWR
ncbi:MAG: 1-deoxy-D-xylulose-5-phosphate reductoisomerase [Candidatus Omnitrophica bacterium]|nr:1-deoxy-D-xylulose-5-phosphate reductoisomerase [Candidatus Omnitrophota bacterium]